MSKVPIGKVLVGRSQELELLEALLKGAAVDGEALLLGGSLGWVRARCSMLQPTPRRAPVPGFCVLPARSSRPTSRSQASIRCSCQCSGSLNG